MLEIYLPIAQVNIDIFLLLFVSLIVGILSGLFGVGGGFLMIRRPPRSTRKESSAASDVYKRQIFTCAIGRYISSIYISSMPETLTCQS